MEELIQHIIYLLDHHECVVVPGMGAFLARSVSARIDEVSCIIYPPMREFSFNAAVTHDDGLLVSSYARKHSVNYTVALNHVRDDVKMTLDALRAGTIVQLHGVGQLFATGEEGVIVFTPVNNSSLTAQGLLSVPVTRYIGNMIARDSADDVALPVSSVFSRTVHGLMRYAAMIVMLITIGIVASTPIVDNGNVEVVKANMSPFTDVESSAMHPELLLAHPVVSDCEIICSEIVLSDDESEEVIVADNILSASSDYVLVIASLVSRAQADAFMAQAGEDAIGCLEVDGRFRIYGAAGSTAGDVMRSPLVDKYPDAWPCRVKAD